MTDLRESKRTLAITTLVAALAFSSLPLASQEVPTALPEEVGMSSERLAKIDSLLLKHIEEGKIQGAVSVVARRGKVVHFKAHGLMDVGSGRAMEKDSIFRMASSSKPLLGVAAMMMIEGGKFKTTDSVAKYLPEFKDIKVAVLKEPADKDVSPGTVWGDVPEHRLVPAQREITIHDLLTHTAGLGTYGLGMAISELPKRFGPDQTLADVVPLYAKMSLDFQPGSRFAYSPIIGLDVVSRIIEVVSGMPYQDFLRARITEPLGMTDTYFFLPKDKEPRRVVIQGLDAKIKGWNLPSRYVSAAGGLSSTARDYMRFQEMLAAGGTLFGKRILTSESVATMSSNQVGSLFAKEDRGKGEGFGFGYTVDVFLDPAASTRDRGKGSFGWYGAHGTMSWTDPEGEITAVLMVQQPTKTLGTEFEKAVRQAIVDR